MGDQVLSTALVGVYGRKRMGQVNYSLGNGFQVK
jgi:hypothetical protein